MAGLNLLTDGTGTGAATDEVAGEASPSTLSVSIPTGMSGLAVYIEQVFKENSDHRSLSGIDAKLLKALRACKAEYSPDEAARLKEAGLSEDIYTPVTDTKRRAAQAQLHEIFTSPGDRPWVIKPTPMPTVPESVAKEAFAEIIAGFVEICEATGTIPAPQDVFKYAESRMDEVHRKQIEWSNIRAERMELKVHDQMIEGGWLQAFNDYVGYIVTYGTALIKGPIPRVMLQRTVKETEVGTYKYVLEPREVLCYEAVNPWDVYPAKGAKRIEDGNICLVVRFTADDLWQYSNVAAKGEKHERGEWFGDTIKALVNHYPNGGVSLQGRPYDVLRQRLENDGVDSSKKCLLEGVEFFGNVKGSELLRLGLRRTNDKEIIDADRFYEVDAITIAGYVIYCKVINQCVGRPLSKGVFYEAVDSWWGDCIADKLTAVQKIMNSALRNLVTNMAMTSGPMFWIKDVSRLVDKSPNALVVKPWKMNAFNTGMQGQTDIPMGAMDVPSRVREMLDVFQWGKTQADEDSGIPAYTYGTNVSGGAGRTASGLAMLTEAANRGMKMVINTTDRDVIRDVVRRTVNYNLVYDKDVSIKGDCEVNPAGVMGMILKEQESNRRKQLLSLMMNPVAYQIVGPKGVAAVLREEIKSLGIANIDDVLPSKERMEELEQLQQLQQLQQAIAAGQQAQQAGMEGAEGQGAPQGVPPSPEAPMTQADVAMRDVQQNPQAVAARGDPAMQAPSQVAERRSVA